jgi:hypothetical protein
MPVAIVNRLIKDLIMRIDIMDKINIVIQVRKKKITFNNKKLEFNVEIIPKEHMIYEYFSYQLIVDKN